MKTCIMALTILWFASVDGLGQSRWVTLLVNGNTGNGETVVSNSVSIATNEVATMRGVFPANGPSCELVVRGIYYGTFQADMLVNRPVAGPAEIRLRTFAGSGVFGLATVEIEPEAFPPGQTIILPEGTVGTVHVESSTNLVTWQDEWSQVFSNTNENRFFRLRAERSLP